MFRIFLFLCLLWTGCGKSSSGTTPSDRPVHRLSGPNGASICYVLDGVGNSRVAISVPCTWAK